MDYLLRTILNSVLGDYLLGIDKNSFKSDFLAGTIGLKDAQLNPKILKDINLPINIIFSHLGNIQLNYSFKKGNTDPTIITVEDVYLVFEIAESMKPYNIIKERTKFLQELSRKYFRKLNNNVEVQPSTKINPLDQMKAKLLERIKIKVKNLHIRIESPILNFAGGITIDEFVAYNTESEEKENELNKIQVENNKKVKKIESILHNLSIYWISKEIESNLASRCKDKSQIIRIMAERIEINKQNLNQEILLSLKLTGNLRIGNDDSQNESTPEVKLKINLSPARAIINEHNINKGFLILQQIIRAKNTRKNKYNSEVFSEKILEDMKKSYPEALTNFLGKFTDASFIWKKELKNQENLTEAGLLRRYMISLPDEDFITLSKTTLFKAVQTSISTSLMREVSIIKNESEEEKKLQLLLDELMKKVEIVHSDQKAGAQLDITIEELTLVFLHQETQSEIEIKFVQNESVFEFKDLSDLSNFFFKTRLSDFSINFYQILNENRYKQPLLRRSIINNFVNLIDLELLRKVQKGGENITLSTRLAGFEILFHQNALIMLEKIFLFKIDDENTDYSEETIDQVMDLKKMTKIKLKKLIKNYYSFLTLDITIGYIGIILPLESAKQEKSDCWVASITNSRVFSNSELKKIKTINYKSFEFTLNEFNSKYFTSLEAYDQFFRFENVSLLKNTYHTLFEDNTVKMMIYGADEIYTHELESSDAKLIIELYFPDILASLNPFILEKILISLHCFTFLIERNLLKEIEFEKNKLMKNATATFLGFSRDSNNLTNLWYQRFILLSGNYLYLYSKQSDLKPIARIPLQKSEFKINLASYERDRVARIKNDDIDYMISIDDEKSFEKFVTAIEKVKQVKMNRDLMEDLEKIEEKEQEEINLSDLEKINKIKFVLKLEVNSLSLHIGDSLDSITNSLILGKFDFEFCSRVLEKNISASIESLTILDNISATIHGDEGYLIHSTSGSIKKHKKKKLINFDACIYEEASPFFKERLNRTEMSLQICSLNINFIPERYAYMFHFFKKPIEKNINEFSVLLDKYREDTVNTKRITKFTKNKQMIRDISGEVSIDELEITFYTDKDSQILSSLKLLNFRTEIAIESISSNIRGSIQNLQYFDLSQPSDGRIKQMPYELIGVQGSKSLFKFDLEIRSNQCLQMTKSDIGIVVKIESHSFRLNYRQLPFQRIFKYFKRVRKSFESEKATKKKIDKNIISTKLINPKLLSVDISIIDAKLFLQPISISNFCYELKISDLKITNAFEKDKFRLKKKIESLDFVYSDNSIIETKSISISKITNQKRKQITNDFGFRAEINRLLWYNDYLSSLGVTHEQAITIIDNSLKINVSINPILIKITQEDCLDLRDIILLNIKQHDQFSSKEKILSERLSEVNSPSLSDPVDIKVKLDFAGAIFVDHILQSPIAKVMLEGFELKYEKSCYNEENCQSKLFGLSATSFDFNEGSGTYLEKSFFGSNFYVKEIVFRYDDEELGDYFTWDLLEKKNVQTEPIFRLGYWKSIDQDEELDVNINKINLMIVIDKMNRLYDFFKIKDPRVKDKPEFFRVQPIKNTKTHIAINVEDTEISIPADVKSYFIIKVNCRTDILKRNLELNMKSEAEEILKVTTELRDIEFLVFHDRIKKTIREKLQKRSIIHKFSILAHLVEYSSFDFMSNTFTSRYETDASISQINVRLAARDLVVIIEAMKKLVHDYEKYKLLPKFEELTKLNEKWQKPDNDGKFRVDYLQHVFRVNHKGSEILCINDIEGNSLPIIELLLYGSRDSPIILEKNFLGIQGKNIFSVSVNFYNETIGFWEPVVEPWSFCVKFDIPEDPNAEIRLEAQSDISSPLLIDYSDEFIMILLKTIHQWDSYLCSEFLEESKKVQEGFEFITPRDSVSILSRSNELEIEYISACTVWNDTCYDVEVMPNELGSSNNFSALKLAPMERKDLMLECTLEKISTGAKNLQNLRASLKVKFPDQDIELLNFDIANKGSRVQDFVLNDGRKGAVICNVGYENQKKLVRFTSQHIVINNIKEDVFIKIIDEYDRTQLINLPAFTSVGLPVDFGSRICFGHYSEIDDNPFFFDLGSLKECRNEIKIGKNYVFLRSDNSGVAFTTLYLEPLNIIKNCLPFSIMIMVKDSDIFEMVEPQSEAQIIGLPSINDITITLLTDNFSSSELKLSAEMPKLLLLAQNQKIELGVEKIKKNFSNKVIIYSKVCVLNLSGKQLEFVSEDSLGLFQFKYDNTFDILLFNQLNKIKIKEKEGLYPQEPLEIDATGTYDIDIKSKRNDLINLSLLVTSECCDPDLNLFTKVVRVYPKMVFINQTRHLIGVEQLQSLVPHRYEPNTNLPLHFTAPCKEKQMTITILKTEGLSGMENGMRWNKSGILNATQPGDYQFLLESQDKEHARFFSLNVTSIQSTFYLTLSEQEPYDALIKVENCSSNISLFVGTQEFFLGPNSKIPYAWPEPTKNDEIPIIVHFENNRATQKLMCSLKRINVETIHTLPLPDNKFISISYIVGLDGGSRVLRISDKSYNVMKKKQESRKIAFSLELENVGISIIGTSYKKKSELLFISMYKFRGIFSIDNNHTMLQSNLKSLYIDNNICDKVLFPVLLSSNHDEGSFFQFNVKIQNKARSNEALHIIDFDIRLLESIVCIDSTTINGMIELIRAIRQVSKQTVSFRNEIQEYLFLNPAIKKLKPSASYGFWGNKYPSQKADFVYIERIRISKLPFSITFRMGDDDLGNYVHSLVNSTLGRTIAKFEDHVICIGEYMSYNNYSTWGVISENIKENYRREEKGIVKSFIKAAKPLETIFKKIIGKENDVGKSKMGMKKIRLPRLFYGNERSYRPYNIIDQDIEQVIKEKIKSESNPIDIIHIEDYEHIKYCFWLTLDKIYVIYTQKKKIYCEIILKNLQDIFVGEGTIGFICHQDITNMGPFLEIRIDDYNIIMNIYSKIKTLIDLSKEKI